MESEFLKIEKMGPGGGELLLSGLHNELGGRGGVGISGIISGDRFLFHCVCSMEFKVFL